MTTMSRKAFLEGLGVDFDNVQAVIDALERRGVPPGRQVVTLTVAIGYLFSHQSPDVADMGRALIPTTLGHMRQFDLSDKGKGTVQ